MYYLRRVGGEKDGLSVPSFNPKRFANPKALQSISPEVLREFLVAHREFIELKGFMLPESCSMMSDFDYLMLTSILMTPDERMSPVLIDALFFIHEMGTEASMNDLLKTAKTIGLEIPDESTPMDVAMRLWNVDKDALERLHAERHIPRSRTFEHYKSDQPLAFVQPSDDQVARMESALDEWFIEHKRGGNCKVFIYPSSDEVWFLIRHGDPYRRESTVEGYNSKGIFFRPEAFDVTCYLPGLGELRVHARNKGERTLYRREFGRLIAGDISHFPGLDKFTLQPLIDDGSKSLACGDIEGIDWIMLTDLRIRRRAIHFSYCINYSASNVFLVLQETGESLRWNDIIEKARFSVMFTGSGKPRSITLTPPNKVQLGRDGDADLVEEWLRRRGFVVSEVSGDGEESETFLVGV